MVVVSSPSFLYKSTYCTRWTIDVMKTLRESRVTVKVNQRK